MDRSLRRILILIATAVVALSPSLARNVHAVEPRVRALSGVRLPYQIVRHGNRVYVADAPWTDRRRISVIDGSRRGGEAIVERIKAPVHPESIAIAGGMLYVVNHRGQHLYGRRLEDGPWVRWPLTASVGPPGPTLYAHGNRLFVVHDRQVDVIDVRNHAVVGRITDFDPETLVDRLAFVGSYLIAQGDRCGTGPSNYSMFRLSDLKRLQRRQLDDYCVNMIAASHRKVYVSSWFDFDPNHNRLTAYDLRDGAQHGSVTVPFLFNAIAARPGIAVADYHGRLALIDFDATRILSGPTSVVISELLWWPAISSMTGSPDRRVFVGNLSDSTVSIVDFAGH